jgi:hypothetical protein
MNFFCDICKKKFSSYQSLWFHNKKHLNNLITLDNDNNTDNDIRCNFCNKLLVNKYSLKRHLLKCSLKLYDDQQNNNQPTDQQEQESYQQSTNTNIQLRIQLIEAEHNKIKEEKEKIEAEQNKIEAENRNLELKLKFEKLLMAKCKMHPKTFKSLNNKLINNSMNNNTINNNIINNFKIYTIGKENLIDILTLNEKADIMRSRFSCLERIVEIAHCSKYDQFKNIIITNLKDNHAYKYDDVKGYFVCIKKNEVISDLVCERLGDIEEIYEELSTTNKLDSNTKRLIKEFLDKIKDEDTYKDNIDGTTYPSFKSYNEHKVKILIYNNSDKINQDLTIIFDSL